MAATPDLMAVALAREVRDGEFVSHGSGVPLAGAALLLARALHAPDVEFFYDGLFNPEAQSLAELEAGTEHARPAAAGFMSQAQIVDFELRGGCDLQFIRPVQIDDHGNVNVSLIGPAQAPRRRFHGIAVADAMSVVGRICLYVTEHTPRVFVERLDYRTGRGHDPGCDWRAEVGLPGGGPSRVVTPLAVMDFEGPGRSLRAVALMPGVTAAEVVAASACRVTVAPDCPPLAPPTAEELRALERVDPLGSRGLEFRDLRAAAQRRLADARRADDPSRT
jgi:glutaconate CoA-transferase subunit B